MTRPEKRGEQGFSLVEAMVSLAIVAAITGAFYQLLASNRAARQAVDDRRMAMLVAQSALDLAAVVGPSAPAARSGRSAGYAWQARGAPAPGMDADALRAEQIEVIVRREKAGQPLLSLQTLVARP